jgi:glutaconyl-CoA/methylmalonyl-CoA decarboxylase subunit gamma
MKHYRISVNGKTYEVAVEEASAAPATQIEVAPVTPAQVTSTQAAPVASQQAVEKAPVVDVPITEAPSGGENILCPMPGNIVSVNVKTGDIVKKGDILLVLEAMKMENEIMSPIDAKVVAVLVKKGDIVNSGTPLINLE